MPGRQPPGQNPQQLDHWRATFDDYVRYIDDFSDPRYLAAHADFHLSLADMSQNPFNVMLVKAAIQAVPQTLREREFSFPKSIDLQQLRESQVKLHRDILDAVANREPESAKAALRAHMDFERDLVIKVYPATADDH